MSPRQSAPPTCSPDITGEVDFLFLSAMSPCLDKNNYLYFRHVTASTSLNPVDLLFWGVHVKWCMYAFPHFSCYVIAYVSGIYPEALWFALTCRNPVFPPLPFFLSLLAFFAASNLFDSHPGLLPFAMCPPPAPFMWVCATGYDLHVLKATSLMLRASTYLAYCTTKVFMWKQYLQYMVWPNDASCVRQLNMACID